MSRQPSGGPRGAKELAWKAFGWAKRHEPEALRTVYAARRAAFVGRLKLLAAWYGAEVEIDVAPDVRLGPGIAITIWPGSRNVVRIGPGSRIDARVLFVLNNGRILFGDRIEIRRDTVFHVWGGTFELAGENIMSWNNVVHCGSSIRVARLTSFAEQVTLVDSTHFFTEPDVFFYHNTRTAPVEIGYNSFIGAKATIGRGASVGDHCIIAGSSVVTGTIPSGHLASGVPAKIVRALELPWGSAPTIAAQAAPATARPKRGRATSG